MRIWQQKIFFVWTLNLSYYIKTCQEHKGCVSNRTGLQDVLLIQSFTKIVGNGFIVKYFKLKFGACDVNKGLILKLKKISRAYMLTQKTRLV